MSHLRFCHAILSRNLIGRQSSSVQLCMLLNLLNARYLRQGMLGAVSDVQRQKRSTARFPACASSVRSRRILLLPHHASGWLPIIQTASLIDVFMSLEAGKPDRIPLPRTEERGWDYRLPDRTGPAWYCQHLPGTPAHLSRN